ncbi:MAG: GNAT family N-acetyltransferase [Synergistaceae bacterium]|nr:GNAT family N-acetyltransferase [Synergistaceae bacterium]
MEHPTENLCFQMVKKVEENFSGTLRLLGMLPTSRMEFRDGSLCVSTGVSIADQNFVWGCLEEDLESGILRAVSFFQQERVPFTWWISPFTNFQDLRKALARKGLKERCTPPAMALDLISQNSSAELPPSVTVRVASSLEDARTWARCSLKGFSSGSEHERTFSAFAEGFLRVSIGQSFRLLTLLYEKSPAATALISFIEETAGLYFFSTVPAFRRKGLGRMLLSRCIEEARSAGCSLMTLQASPDGYPLYLGAGFRECFRFSVFSSDPDAC